MTKRIILSTGEYALVDDDMFEYLNRWSWRLRHGYVVRASKNRTIAMHREIMKPKKDMEIDHINGNVLDNRRFNLRICTRSQNQINQGPRKDNPNGYKGVTLHKKTGKWQAQIEHNKRCVYLGLFTDIKEAARAYDQKAKELFGEFAWLNFPNGQERSQP